MNKHYRKVQSVLKTRKDVTALGFSRKELKGVAANIADKLKLDDDASEEDVNDAIDEAIDAAMPFLKLTQSVSERRLQSYKDSQKPEDDDEEDDDEDDQRQKPSEGKEKPKKGGNESDAFTAALQKALGPLNETIKTLKDELAVMKSGSVASLRRAKVEELVKDTGRFGERTLKSFSRMKFDTDEEFEDYLDEVKEDIEAENQARANEGLEALTSPPAPDPKKTENEEVISDDDMKALAKMS